MDMVWVIKCYFSFVLLIAFKKRPKREFVQRIGKALSMRELTWIYEVFINHLEKDLLLYTHNDEFQTEFLNKGKGKGSIQSYRKIEGKNVLLFEKIYFNDRSEWKKTDEFYDKIFEKTLNSGIKVPRLLQTNEGDDLIVTYTEYIDLEPIESSQYFEKAIDMATRITSIPYQYPTSAFPELLDYNSDTNFKLFKRRLVSYLETNDNKRNIGLFRRIEKYIEEQTERSLCHGDLCNNLFKNNKLIDWDRLGYYPIGYDFAMILIHIHQRDELSIDRYLKLEEEFYRKVSQFVSKANFKMSLSYFTLVFLHYNLKTTIEIRHALLLVIKERVYPFDQN